MKKSFVAFWGIVLASAVMDASASNIAIEQASKEKDPTSTISETEIKPSNIILGKDYQTEILSDPLLTEPARAHVMSEAKNMGNSASIMQKGNSNVSSIVQQGSDNNAYQTQNGNVNELYVEQNGLHNNSDEKQTGHNNHKLVIQNGKRVETLIIEQATPLSNVNP